MQSKFNNAKAIGQATKLHLNKLKKESLTNIK